jgi:hypothetical protein
MLGLHYGPLLPKQGFAGVLRRRSPLGRTWIIARDRCAVLGVTLPGAGVNSAQYGRGYGENRDQTLRRARAPYRSSGLRQGLARTRSVLAATRTVGSRLACLLRPAHDLGVRTELPIGTVTFLLTDVEGSTKPSGHN